MNQDRRDRIMDRLVLVLTAITFFLLAVALAIVFLLAFGVLP